MFIHPNQILWLHEQDRERAATKRALERAARGGEPDDGHARGGISLANVLDRAIHAVTHLRVDGPTSSSPLTGPTGA